MNIPIFDLTRQYQTIKHEIDETVGRVLTKGHFTLGEEVSLFETEFAVYIGAPFTVGVASGTDALALALRALGIGEGDEVVLPANAYPSAFGVALAGCRIRLADSLPDGTIDSESVQQAITPKTKAVIPVHLYGNPADISSLKRIILEKENEFDHKIYLVEDAAQAHGAKILVARSKNQEASKNNWKKVGGIGDVGCFSFYPSKNLGAYGDGGMIVTHSQEIAERVKKLRMYGEKERYKSLEVSGISRLDELQAAVLRVKLRHLDTWNKKRKNIATFYQTAFKNLPIDHILLPPDEEHVLSAHHLFVIQTKKRLALQNYLSGHGIGTAIHYPVPIHLTPSFAPLGYHRGDFPVSELQSTHVLSLPMFAELSDSEVEIVAERVKRFFTANPQ